MGDTTNILIPHNFAVDEAMEFRQQVYGQMEKGQKDFVLDFSKCSFIDSTGLGVLVSSFKKCSEFGGSFKLVSINNQNVLKVFKLARLDRIFDIG